MEQITLRQWADADLEPYAAMNADPEVMQHFPRRLTRDESKTSMLRLRADIERQGWGLWVVDVDGEFAGFTGLSVPRFEAPFMPCTEIGWRLHRRFWGRGIACRAAQEALAFGFSTLRLPELVSFTAVPNVRSQRLMARLGFARRPEDDFDHPLLEPGHPLRRHVLYRKGAQS